MAGMTAAFAAGQLAGPFTVTLLPAAPGDALTVPLAVAAGILVLGAFALARPAPTPAATLHEERSAP
jgi:hypothetical protein